MQVKVITEQGDELETDVDQEALNTLVNFCLDKTPLFLSLSSEDGFSARTFNGVICKVIQI